MKAIGYLRVSTNEQKIKGVSLANQEDKIRSYCKLYNIELQEIIKDPGISAKDLKRPGIQRIIEKVKKKEIEAIVCLKLDRLTRSVRDLAYIVELINRHGVSLISVHERLDTGTASGRMVINLLATVSQWEREVISERTKSALQYKKGKGEVVGEIPFGFRRNGDKLVAVPQEQKIISIIKNLKSRGNSYRQIAVKLNNKGLRPKNGQKWFHTQVFRVLKAA